MLTIAEFGRLWRRGEMTARDLVERCLTQIDRDQPRLNAFILVMADEARRQAEDADRERAAGLDRGPLHGVPISLKDLIRRPWRGHDRRFSSAGRPHRRDQRAHRRPGCARPER